MADQTRQTQSHESQPSPAALLRAALEKIVFFEWRLSELAAELSASLSRAAAAESERTRAEEAARTAQQQAQAARLALAEMEAERVRLTSLLARPAHAPQSDGASSLALEAERGRAARLAAELEGARREIQRHRAERDRWLSEMIEQARVGGDAPAALAEFISELRGEVIALREREKITDAMMGRAGMTVPPPARQPAPSRIPQREPAPVEAARAMWAEGRLGGATAENDRAQAVAATSLPPPTSKESPAARALAEQCLRGLQAPEATRRAQAALHLSAVPAKAAAPLIAHALGVESDSRARAALVKALVACGGEGAAELAQGLLSPAEPPLVRLAAVEALAALGGDHGKAALEAGARDSAPAVRRRTAALLLGHPSGDELLQALARDADASVRAAAAPDESRAKPAASAAPPRGIRDLAAEAMLACRSAIFGLSDDELGQAMSLDAAAVQGLVAQLTSAGMLLRRGKRLVAVEERR